MTSLERRHSCPITKVLPYSISPQAFVGGALVQGSYAYLSYLDGGLEIVDFSDPDSPRSAGYAASSGEANDLAVRYGVAFVQLNPRLQNTCVEWYSPRKDAALRGVFSHPPHLDASVLLRQSFLVLRLFICRE